MDQRRPPARVPGDDDRADGGPGLRLGLHRRDPRADRPVPDVAGAGGGEGHEHEPVMSANLIMALTFLLVLAGAALAWRRYWRDDVSVIAPSGNVLTEAARRDLYQDTVNEALLMHPGIAVTRG